MTINTIKCKSSLQDEAAFLFIIMNSHDYQILTRFSGAKYIGSPSLMSKAS